MKRITKKELRVALKVLYTKAKRITNAMINRFQECLHRIQAKLGIPVIKLRDCANKCHISTNNIKTDIPSWSTYPGDSVIHLKDGRKVSDMHGTCGSANCKECKNWKSCYAIRMLRYPDVAKNYIENTMYLRNDINGLEMELVKQIKKLKSEMFRFDVSEEIETFEQLIMFLSVAYQNSNKTFYVYTKNYDVVDRYFNTGCELPDNFHILISVWHNSGIACYLRHKHHKNVHAFVYQDGYDYKSKGLELLEANRCKAYNQDGKLNHNITCLKCRKCWTKDIIWTYPH